MLENLRETLTVIRNCGLRLKREKCSFMVDEVIYLGLLINSKGVAPVKAKLDPILKMPTPTNEIETILGYVELLSTTSPAQPSRIARASTPVVEKRISTEFEQDTNGQFRKCQKITMLIISASSLRSCETPAAFYWCLTIRNRCSAFTQNVRRYRKAYSICFTNILSSRTQLLSIGERRFSRSVCRP